MERCRSGAEGGGEVFGAAEETGQGDRVHVIVVADDLAVANPDDAERGEPIRLAGHRRLDEARAGAVAADPGEAFFGFLGRLSQEAAAKRDLPEAISVEGGLRDSMQDALGVLLVRAQRAGAVRPDVGTGDLIILLKGIIRSIQDTPPGAAGDAQRERLFAVLTDGLRHAGA